MREKKKYKTVTLICAFEYFALSRSAYSRMREDYELPIITTLTRLTSEVKTLDDMFCDSIRRAASLVEHL